METGMLKEAGLTDGEIKVYLALLELGPSSSGPVIEKSGVSRSIIYRILGKLAQKGLVAFVVRGKTRYFQAEEPGRIMEYVEERQRKLGESRKKIEEALPSLLSLAQQAGKRSEVKVYQGFRGMMTAHELTYQRLKRGDEYFYMNVPVQPENYHAYWKKDHVRRVRAGIECKLLFDPTVEKDVLKNRNRYKGCEARYMPVWIKAPVWFAGYKDVALIHLVSSQPITIEITNQEVADSFRAYFEEFWRMSKPFGKGRI
ncbi:MAG: helix-turn-helix domain-containing protein [Candidatus ainarchaeum sp.]|nr:helix-turn-helix domain-containing protein [Candidatus ainarchaeum sp.]